MQRRSVVRRKKRGNSVRQRRKNVENRRQPECLKSVNARIVNRKTEHLGAQGHWTAPLLLVAAVENMFRPHVAELVVAADSKIKVEEVAVLVTEALAVATPVVDGMKAGRIAGLLVEAEAMEVLTVPVAAMEVPTVPVAEVAAMEVLTVVAAGVDLVAETVATEAPQVTTVAGDAKYYLFNLLIALLE